MDPVTWFILICYKIFWEYSSFQAIDDNVSHIKNGVLTNELTI